VRSSLVDAGTIVLCRSFRPSARSGAWSAKLVGVDEFVEVYLGTPLEECMRGDPKGCTRER